MIFEILKASLMGALPVAAFTFLILQWSIVTGRLKAFDGETDLGKLYKNQAKAQKEAQKKAKEAAKKAKREMRKNKSMTEKTVEDNAFRKEQVPLFSRKRGGDIFHGKIMSFGGGFYGTMAVLTYILIELIEIWQFLAKIFGPGSWFENIGIGMLIDFIINSIMNFIAAFIWFKTLADYLPVGNGWVWLAAAYLGYMAGLKLVTHHGDDIWKKIITLWPKEA